MGIIQPDVYGASYPSSPGYNQDWLLVPEPEAEEWIPTRPDNWLKPDNELPDTSEYPVDPEARRPKAHRWHPVSWTHVDYTFRLIGATDVYLGQRRKVLADTSLSKVERLAALAALMQPENYPDVTRAAARYDAAYAMGYNGAAH